MSEGLIQNYEYIGAHIKEYFEDNKLFDTFEKEDIAKIMKFAILSTDDFRTILEQAHSTNDAKKLYFSTRYANITIQNFEDAISLLKSLKKYLKMKILDGVIDFFIQSEKEKSDLTKQIQNLQERLNTFQNQERNREIQTLIADLKNSNEFESIYDFLNELSSQGNKTMLSKACEEGLWKKLGAYNQNVLHEASRTGNLRLVKSLIECNCDKDIRDVTGHTPLILASYNGHLEVVQYLISIGANREAKTKDGFTPLIWASAQNRLEVVKYLVSAGADKEAMTNIGYTPLIWASYNGHLGVVQYLISFGANKEAKTKDGFTPLIWASVQNRLEVVKYLVSVGADKEAKTNDGFTPLLYASFKGLYEIVKYLESAGAIGCPKVRLAQRSI